MPQIVTPDQLLERIDAELARRSLAEFVRCAWPIIEPATPMVPNWHISAIAEHLEAVTHGEIRNLLINIPPRCMKSSMVSVLWPMWVWTNTPSFKWLFASYALSLAIRDSVKSRRLVESDWYQRHYGDTVRLVDDQNQKSRYETTAGGYRICTSVGSGVTGEGGEIIVCDDPHNVVDTESQTMREAALEWWDQAISSRLNDPKTGSKVVIMQRIHANDLSAHILEQGDYVHLNLPMEYEPEHRCVTSIGWQDPRTEEGELLWPERIGLEEVARLKRALGPYGFAGQYQQRPTPRAGGAFQRAWMDRRYRELPTMRRVIQTIDSAFKEGVANDYSVIATWGTDGVDFYLIHIWRDRVAFPDLLQAIRDQHARFRPAGVYIEDKASGQSAIQTLQRTSSIAIIPVPADGSKESRADAVSPLFAAHKVVLPEDAEWLDAWIDEHVTFPRGAHDDMPDTTAYALRILQDYLASSMDVWMSQMEAATAHRLAEHEQKQRQPFHRLG